MAHGEKSERLDSRPKGRRFWGNAGSREFMKNKTNKQKKKKKKRKNVGVHNKGSIGIKLHFTDKAIGHLLSQLTKYWYFIPLDETKAINQGALIAFFSSKGMKYQYFVS